MTTADRVLAVLKLFSMERPEWTVEAAARELGLSQSTAYQYFRSLVEARLLVAFKTGRYVIGPAVIELDRQIRRLDPLIAFATPAVTLLSTATPGDGVVLLCRLYGHTVMCVDQRPLRAPGFEVSYERGRPMPLSRGAASKVILAHLPPRFLRRYFDENAPAIESAGLGANWKSFQTSLRKLRKAGVCVTQGELDVGLVGISGPVFGPDGDILGSIGLVLKASQIQQSPELMAAAMERVRQAGQAVTANLTGPSEPTAPSPLPPELAPAAPAKRPKATRGARAASQN